MWQRKRIENQDYYINAEYDAEEHKLIISMSSIEESWSSEMSDDDVVNIIKQLNPGIEAEDTGDLIIEIVDLFDASRTDVEWCIIEKKDSRFKLKISSTLGGVEFNFQTALRRSDSERTFTTSFLVIIQSLLHQRDELCKFIKKKDTEISEYKLNGATVTRKNVETPTFQENFLDELFTQNLPCITSKSAKELFDRAVFSYFNQVQPVVRRKMRESQRMQEPSKMPTNSGEVPISGRLTTEIKEQEKIEVPASRKTTSVAPKNKPIKKLKNF